MLDSMRDMARTPFIKIIFLALMASFALWGIGDVFRGGGGSHYAAKVGDEKIAMAEFNAAVKQELARFQQLFNAQQIPPSVSAAVNASVLERFIDQSILRQEVARLGMKVTDEAIKKRIAEEPAFQENGKFSPELFRRLLQQNRITENKYIAMLKHETNTTTLINGLTSASIPVQHQARLMHQFANEIRTINVLSLPESIAGAAPKPQDSEVTAYYEEHKDDYATDEFRAFSYVVLTANDAANAVEISDAEINEYYQTHGQAYVDEAGKQKTLEQARETIIKELKETRQQEALYKTAAQIEDTLAGGAALKDVAANFNLKLVSVPAVNKTGLSPENTKVAEFPANNGIVETAFSMAETDNPSLILAPDHSYIAVKVDQLVAPRIRNLDEVRASVETAWQGKWRVEELKKKATKIREELAAGKTSEQAAKDFALPAPKSYSITRDPQKAPKELSPTLLDDVFMQPVNSPTTFYMNDEGLLQIAVTTAVKLPEAVPDAELLPISAQVEKGFYDDVLYYYGKKLRANYSVESYVTAAEPPTQQ